MLATVAISFVVFLLAAGALALGQCWGAAPVRGRCTPADGAETGGDTGCCRVTGEPPALPATGARAACDGCDRRPSPHHHRRYV